MRGKLPLAALMSSVESNASILADGASGRKVYCLSAQLCQLCSGSPDHIRRHTEPTQLTCTLEAIRECAEPA